MDEILKFLQDTKVFYLATADGDQPCVRPLGFVMERNGKLVFSTSGKKAMCQKLKQNNKVEICAYNGKETLRLRGDICFITSPETQQAALDAAPFLARSYAVNDGVFELYEFNSGTATFSDLAGNIRAKDL